MRIELSDEQEKRVKEGCTVDIVDSVDGQPYVLLALEQFERVRHLFDDRATSPVEDSSIQVSPIMLRSQEAYWRDLPELLKHKTRKQQWAAYSGDERICLSRTDVEAYQTCLRRGLNLGEFFVGLVKLDPDGLPPWGTIETDRSLFEFTESDYE